MMTYLEKIGRAFLPLFALLFLGMGRAPSSALVSNAHADENQSTLPGSVLPIKKKDEQKKDNQPCNASNEKTCCLLTKESPLLPRGCPVPGGLKGGDKLYPDPPKTVAQPDDSTDPMRWATGSDNSSPPRIAIMEFGFPGCPPCERSHEVLDLIAQRCGTPQGNVRAMEGLAVDMDPVLLENSTLKNWNKPVLPGLVSSDRKHALMRYPDNSTPGSLNLVDQMSKIGFKDPNSFPFFVVMVNGRVVYRKSGGFLDYTIGGAPGGTEGVATSIKRRASVVTRVIEDNVREVGGPAAKDFKCSSKMADGTDLPPPP